MNPFRRRHIPAPAPRAAVSGTPGPGRGRRDFPGLAGTLDSPGEKEDGIAPAGERSERQTPSQLPGGGPASSPPGAEPARAVPSAGSGLDSGALRAGINDREQQGRTRAGPMEEAGGPSEGAVGPEAERPTSPELLARGAEAPSKSKEALGKHPSLYKVPTLGFPPALRPFPTSFPWEEAERGFFLLHLLPPVAACLAVWSTHL